MALNKHETFNNLIDVCIEYELDPKYGGNVSEIFKRIIIDCFFKNEAHHSKSMEQFFEEFEPPPFLKSIKSMHAIDIGELENFVNGETINQSLCGKIMLSKIFLKAFYPDQTPSFNSFAEDIKFELIGKIKDKNKNIIDAFEKMKSDRETGKNRKVLTLVSIILKNIHIRTGRPFNKLQKSAEDIIKSIISSADEKFIASGKQMSILSDDFKAKELVKTFFVIKQFKDIEDISKLYKIELERFRKRSLWSK